MLMETRLVGLRVVHLGCRVVHLLSHLNRNRPLCFRARVSKSPQPFLAHALAVCTWSQGGHVCQHAGYNHRGLCVCAFYLQVRGRGRRRERQGGDPTAITSPASAHAELHAPACVVRPLGLSLVCRRSSCARVHSLVLEHSIL